jgi:GNAT superfamily N-acetyltransferase
MAILIRPAAPEDAPGACQAVRRSIMELCHADHHGDPERIARWLSNKTPAHFERWISSPENLGFLAERDGSVVGFALLEKTGHLGLLYVSPDARFQGVSTGLLAAVEEAARKLGVEMLRLESSHTAREFYRARGYEPDGDPTPRSFPLRKRLG